MQLSKATSFSSTVVALVACQVGPSVWVLVSCNDILIHTVHEEGLMLIIIQKDCLPFSMMEKSLKMYCKADIAGNTELIGAYTALPV